MKLIVGLGNPGKEYDGTRHNAGFLAVDALADALGFEWKKDAKRHALIAHGSIGDETLILAKPQTFMNESGASVQGFVTFYHIEFEDILIVHDEMDLEPGRISFATNAGHAGHNGVRDIQERLGTKGIARLRIGVGRPIPPIAKEDWVLTTPKGDEKTAYLEGIDTGSDAAKTWIEEGLAKAMNQWN
jgi:PTH1 family peptidyl-tRNA hydrolase